MAEESNNNGASGLMKKLLFPASTSGANDTFIPKVAPASSVHAAAAAAAAAVDNNNNNNKQYKQPVPPRFFSSTHPSTGAVEKCNSSSPEHAQHQPLQTPVRVPSSPPRLHRQPVTLSSEMGAMAAATKEDCEAASSKPRQQNKDNLFKQTSSMSVEISRPSDETTLPEEEVPLARDMNGSGIKKENTQAESNVEDESLLFLKQFKQNRQQQHTGRNNNDNENHSDDEETETEVHNNTSAAQQLRQQQQQRVLAAAKEATRNRIEPAISERTNSRQEDDGSPERNSSRYSPAVSGQQQQQTTMPTPIIERREQEEKKFRNSVDTPLETAVFEPPSSSTSNEDISSYPSYYDNPYHNPLVASAMKPNDLFRDNNGNAIPRAKSNNNDDDDDDDDASQDSDVNSNASEFGTVIGGPMATTLADRFAEVDAMEREGKLAMQQDDNQDEGGAAAATMFDLDEEYDDEEHNMMTAGMLHNHDSNDDEDNNMFDLDAEDDPDLANYKAFRVTDDVDDEEDLNDQHNNNNNNSTTNHSDEHDDSFLQDPFQSPAAHLSSGQHRHHHQQEEEQSQVHSESTKRLGDVFPEDLFKRDELSAREAPIRDAVNGEAALSIIDSEIDQLVRRSASSSSQGSSGGHGGDTGGATAGPINSCNSNNSAEVFRVPSSGSVGERVKYHAKPSPSPPATTDNSGKPPMGHQHRQLSTPPSSAAGRPTFSRRLSSDTDKEDDEELQAIDATRSPNSSTISSEDRRKKRPNSSLQRALSNPMQQQQEDNPSPKKEQSQGMKKEDEKEEKEDDHLHGHQKFHFEVPKDEEYNEFNEMFTAVDTSHHASAGGPGADLANTLRRIGDKLVQRSPQRTSKSAPPAGNQFFFDIDDDENSSLGQNHFENGEGIRRLPGISVSAPTTPRLQRKDREEQQQEQHVSNSQYSLSKIQEAFPQSPGRDSGNGSQAAPSSFLLRSPGSSVRLMADFRRESSSSGVSVSGNGNGRIKGVGEDDSQRFAVWNGRVPNILQSESSASLGNGSTPRAKGGRQPRDFDDIRSTKAMPLRFARGCMSFDTTVDNHYDYDENREKALFRATSNSITNNNDGLWLRATQSYDVRQHSHASPSRPAASAFRQRVKDIGGRITGKSGTQAMYGTNRSWDFSRGQASSATTVGTGESLKGSQSSGPAAVNLDASAFRVAPYVRQEQQQQHPHAHGFNNSNGSRLISGERSERLRLMNEASVAPGQHIGGFNQQQRENLELLQMPQRLEIEREDALNLLACLCERGVAQDNDTKEEVDNNQGGKLSKPIDQPEDQATDNSSSVNAGGQENANARRSNRGDLEIETIYSAVDLFRELSKARSDSEGKLEQDVKSQSIDHQMRMQVLDELVLSHTYAGEMKRASMSANAWLRSIGRSDSNGGDGEQLTTEAGQAAGEGEEALIKQYQNRSASSNDVDLLAMKALLHQAQIETREKAAAARQLNEELSKCRAEIGRLLSVSRSKTNNFTSPNRSILDDEDDDESTGSANEWTSASRKDKREKLDRSQGVQRVESHNFVEESVVDLDSSLFGNEETAEVLRDSDQPVVRELVMFKSALADANSVIKQLHSELQDSKPSDGARKSEAPVIEVSEKAFSVALIDETTSPAADKSSNSSSDQHPDNRTVNVRMLDGENFVTDWDSVESLPPPPDHGLRSPIVSVLLQQWSKDEALHNSLVAWMDRAISGEDPALIPPLTLSSLDHQVRDGFTMHVLPLLLRRPDILVDVKTRAHRTTTYDIAVSVKTNSRVAALPMRTMRHMESAPDSASAINSVTHSAVTAHVQNGHFGGNDCNEIGSTAASIVDGTTDSNYASLLPQRSSDDSKSEITQQPVGIMGALGGALGGLLSRRKPNPSNYYDAGVPTVNNSYDMGSAVGAAGPGPMDFPPHTPDRGFGSEHSDQLHDPEEPYHRLVSAPPGRIGVSFVEYRGHAMVSDVSADDSPLSGWIFPSDILIAIDEVPVSGMKLKDIVKILQSRSERQRALRVISSHAMKDLTMTPS